MKKKLIKYTVILLYAIVLAACSEDPEPTLPAPKIDNLELGSGNNGIAVIGQDFHFNADVVAGDKIEIVELTIRQKDGENYGAAWSMSVLWEQYKGLKNANIHKHFDIPEDAVPGIYEAIILVKDQNGETTERLRKLSIHPEEISNTINH